MLKRLHFFTLKSLFSWARRWSDSDADLDSCIISEFNIRYLVRNNKIYMYLNLIILESVSELETSLVLKRMHRRIIKNFLDVLILAELRNGSMAATT